MEKAVISARVPVKFKEDFVNWAKANNTTVSEHIQNLFENVDGDFIPKADSVKIDNSLRDMLLAVGGGSAIAVLVYKAIVAILTDKYPLMSKDDIEMYAIGGAVFSGILGGIGVNKLINLFTGD